MTNIDFPEWLQQQLDAKNWRVTDLANNAHISAAAVSRILNSQRNADTNTLLSFAEALNISPITIFRKAGLLPEGGDHASFEDWQYLIKQLTPDEEEEMRQIMELKIERRQKAELASRSKNFKPKKVG